MDNRDETPLAAVFEGWEGYNASIIAAISPRSPDELSFRPAKDMRSVGETAAHIALGRIDWFHRMDAPASEPLATKLSEVEGAPSVFEPQLARDAGAIVQWLNESWTMVDATLRAWTVRDLWTTFRQPYAGKVYAVSRQWVFFRMLAHDIQHGGQISAMLGQLGIAPTELTYLGGHLTEPPLADAG